MSALASIPASATCSDPSLSERVYERAKNHQPDISTGSQKGSFMGHYVAEQRAV